jgi:hypothetical protein
MNPIKQDIDTVTRERDHWYAEAIAAQEMLAQVLQAVGGPVEVKQRTPLPETVGVFIDFDEARGVFIFEVAERDGEGNRVTS